MGKNKNGPYNGIIFADLHIGAMDLDKIYEEFEELIMYRIRNRNDLNFIVVCGDFFDKKYYLNDKCIWISYKIIGELISLCREKNIALRFVHGTESHDCGQYSLIDTIKAYDNVKVIKHVSDEELLPGLNVLYVPEEYVYSKKDYYDGYLYNTDKKYNYIFGHGVIREVMSDISIHMKDTDNSKRKHAPVFSTADLLSVCDGEVYFGHYHINNEFKDRVFSIGSFSRWKFGEEGRKGFYEVSYDIDKNKFYHNFVENTLADKYDTVVFGKDSNIFTSIENMEKNIDAINNSIEKNPNQHTRYIYSVPDNFELSESFTDMVKNRIKRNDNIKINITKKSMKSTKTEDDNETEEDDKYSFLLSEIPLYEKIKYFIEIEYGRNIQLEEIKKYILNDVEEIIK